MTDNKKRIDRREEEGEGSHIGHLVSPDSFCGSVHELTAEQMGFQQAFLDTLAHKGEGLLTRYLYHDPSGEEDAQKFLKISELLKKHFGEDLYGARAWDANIRNNQYYGLANGDMEALEYALELHVVSRLPEKMRLIEYGAGGEAGAVKPAKLIRAIMKEKSLDSILSYTAIDIVHRFASKSACSIYDEFNLNSFNVVCGFMATERVGLPEMKDEKNYTPVLLLFGNVMANAPDSSLGGGKDAWQNVTTYLSRMNRQFGMGSRILMTYHAQNDPAVLLNEYQPTPQLQAFVLTNFPRAMMQGVISDPQYDPFQRWHIKPTYDAATKAMKYHAVSRENHIISIGAKDISISKGESFINAVVYEWDEHDYESIVAPAGYEIKEVYRRPGTPRGVLLMEAVRPPSL